MVKLLPLFLIVIVLAGAGYLLLSGKDANKSYIPQFTKEPSSENDYSDQAVDQQAKNQIVITSAGYEPAEITIKAGEEVVWINNSGTTATVNSGPHPTHEEYAPLNSVGDVAPGNSESFTFEQQGTYHYHNHFNEVQEGVVVVK